MKSKVQQKIRQMNKKDRILDPISNTGPRMIIIKEGHSAYKTEKNTRFFAKLVRILFQAKISVIKKNISEQVNYYYLIQNNVYIFIFLLDVLH